MHTPYVQAIVQSFTGREEVRQVRDVDEWCLEQTVDKAAVVMTLTTVDGRSELFRLSSIDARDIGIVLKRLITGH